MPTQRLTIFLLRDIEKFDDALADDGANGPEIGELTEASGLTGRFYSRKNFPSTPAWAKYIEPVVVGGIHGLQSASGSGLLVLTVDGHTFALSFGYGRSFLNQARIERRFGLKPKLLAADTAYGSAPMLNWLVEEKGILPHVPVIDKSVREDGSFSRADFRYDVADDVYICPANKVLRTSGTIVNDDLRLYRGTTADCRSCPLKPRCCPKEPMRKIPRSIYEAARDVARSLFATEAYAQSRRDRKKVEMQFAHLKRILRLDRLRLRGPRGARDEFLLAATAQNLRKLAKLLIRPPPDQGVARVA